MNKLLAVAWREYRRHVFRKRFLLALLSVPFFLMLSIGLAFLGEYLTRDVRPLGYVDPAGWIQTTQSPYLNEDFENVPLQSFANENTARAALDSGEIQAYIFLPADYLQSNSVKLVYNDQPNSSVTHQFHEILRYNLLLDRSPQITGLLLDGPQWIIRSADGSREVGQDSILSTLMPLLTGLLAMIMIMTSSGYLMQAVVEEKENRTMEILVTSMRPVRLLQGKLLGITAIMLTQIGVWGLFIVLTILLGREHYPWMRQIHLTKQVLGLIFGVLLPTYGLLGSLMLMIGATITESSEAQQYGGLISIPLFLPFWLLTVIGEHPNSPLSVALSLFPFTAPTTLSIRMTVTTLPAWQYALSIGLLWASAIAGSWLAGKAFRLGMLAYGKRIRLRDIFGWQSRPAGGQA